MDRYALQPVGVERRQHSRRRAKGIAAQIIKQSLDIVILLYTAIDEAASFQRKTRISEWRQRKHIVQLMPWEQLLNYLRFDVSSSLALVDAIVCDTEASPEPYSISSFTEPTYPLAQGLQLADSVSSLPDGCAMHDGRKWKNVPFLILPNAMEIESQVFYKGDATILPLYCNRLPSLALAKIQECVDAYYDHVIQDYQDMGMRVRYREGHTQIGPAKRSAPGYESNYYSAAKDRRDHKRWLTIKRDDEGVRNDVEVLQRLLDRSASETEMHQFLEQHPSLLTDAMLGVPHSHKPRFRNPEGWKPDFALSPVLGPLYSQGIDLVELKGPDETLITGPFHHRGFSQKVHRAVDQVRDYSRYLTDPANLEAVKKAFGYLPLQSKLAVLIGRDPHMDDCDIFEQRQSEIDVRVVTYDRILLIQASQINNLLS